jgi:Tfp pilus assembly protein PilE
MITVVIIGILASIAVRPPNTSFATAPPPQRR